MAQQGSPPDDTVDGTSPEGFKAAAEDGWEKAKAKWGTPRRLKVVDQWVVGTNPITEYGFTFRRVH